MVFGAHAMVFAVTNNRLDARSVSAVALYPSNSHGGHYFMSLYSGERIHSYHWKEVPIDDDVIDRVEMLVEEEKAPEMVRGFPTFVWNHRQIERMGLEPSDTPLDHLPIDNMSGLEIDEELGAKQIDDEEQQLSTDEPVDSDDELLSFDSSTKTDEEQGRNILDTISDEDDYVSVDASNNSDGSLVEELDDLNMMREEEV